MRWLFVWLALLAAVVGAPAAAQLELPARPDGPVYDGANVIGPVDEQLLDAKLRAYNERTGRSLIVATVPSLQEDTVENFAVRLYQAWGIGGAETDAGVLMLVAPTEHEARIEVGYGLHQYVTDILSGRIMREQMIPRFKENDYAGGINAGIEALITQLDLDPADAKAINEAAAAAARNRDEGGGFPIGTIIWLGFLFIFFILPMLGRVRGKRYRGGGVAEGVGNVLLWTAVNAAMNSGRGGGGGGWSGGGGGGGGGFGGFGGGMSGGGGASGSW